MRMGVRYKGPDEIRAFTFNWERHLGDRTIVDFDIATDSGIAVDSSALVEGAQKVTVVVSGGEAGNDYAITNTIVTSTGETFERTGTIGVRNV